MKKLDKTGPDDLILREPFMFFDNFTGLNQQVTVDFNDLSVIQSVPTIRPDNKVIFNVDQDGYVDSKYDYFYYEIGLEKTLTKPVSTLYLTNDRNLLSSLENLCLMIGLYSNEYNVFNQFVNFELKKHDTKFWKADIFTEEKLNSEFPISVYPEPDFFIRRYIKFTPSDKNLSKNTKFNKDSFGNAHRSGLFRCIEVGFLVDPGKIK